MSKGSSDRLEVHSLLLMTATMIGHVGNYVFHLLTGRMLPEAEYGLMIALFGAVNLILFPMTALQISLTRTVASLSSEHKQAEIHALLKMWFVRSALFGLAGFGLLLVVSPGLTSFFGMTTIVPLLIAGLIPVLNLFLTLSGAALQGLQRFGVFSLRGAVLFTLRAALVSICLILGYKVAGSGLAAHVMGMTCALGISLWGVRNVKPGSGPAKPSIPVITHSLTAFPILLAFSALMTADVILIRSYMAEDLSGEFAQAATLARMILWLPLPIAQVMFPKVVRLGAPSQVQKTTLFKALGYTLGLVVLALGGLWIAGDLIFEWLFGQPPSSRQSEWLKGIGLCMALLGPVYVVMQFELARNRIRRLLPLCALSFIYVIWSWVGKLSPEEVIRFLLVATALSLLTAGRALAAERDLQSDPSP